MIGMVDLTHEIDRRLRHAMGLDDIKPMGEQISKGLEGPFPPPSELHNFVWGTWEKEPFQFSAEKEALYNKLYEEHPEVIFASTELQRRWLRMGEPEWFLNRYFMDHLPLESSWFYG